MYIQDVLYLVGYFFYVVENKSPLQCWGVPVEKSTIFFEKFCAGNKTKWSGLISPSSHAGLRRFWLSGFSGHDGRWGRFVVGFIWTCRLAASWDADHGLQYIPNKTVEIDGSLNKLCIFSTRFDSNILKTHEIHELSASFRQKTVDFYLLIFSMAPAPTVGWKKFSSFWCLVSRIRWRFL